MMDRRRDSYRFKGRHFDPGNRGSVRLEPFEEAERVFDRMLWVNPSEQPGRALHH
jgi:hypothetical protein